MVEVWCQPKERKSLEEALRPLKVSFNAAGTVGAPQLVTPKYLEDSPTAHHEKFVLIVDMETPGDWLRLASKHQIGKFILVRVPGLSPEGQYQALLRHPDFQMNQNLVAQRERRRKLESEEAQLMAQALSEDDRLKEASKAVRGQVKSIEALNTFIVRLSECSNVEDLMDALRHVLQSSSVLAHLQFDSEGGSEFFYTQGRSTLHKRMQEKTDSSSRISVDKDSEQRAFAELIGRPVSRLISIPLPLRRQTRLYFEYGLVGGSPEALVSWFSEMAQSFSVALDRVLLTQDLLSGARAWERTFDGIGDPICILDMEFNLLRSNRNFNQGHPSGVRCFERLSGRSSPCPGCPRLTGDGVGQIRVNERRYQVHSYPISLREGETPTTFVHHYVDVSKSAELYSQVVQTEKLSALGHLSGHIAHELNNPLTGIRSMAQMLVLDLPEGHRVRSDLVEVEKAAERCQKIIHNLREFSSLERRRVRVDLNEILKNTLGLLKTATGHFQRELELCSYPLFVFVEPQLLQQVIFNLVVNAGQAMGESGTLWISTEIRGGRGEVRVRDSGPGIPPENRDKIFEPFFTTKGKGAGTGLGLSVSRRIVEKFGGELSFYSPEAGGAEFVVSIPLADS